jgi:glutathione S-transferase
MSAGNKPYALGTDTYTLGDVLVTNLMSRLITDPKFFKIAVMDVPVLKTYWERMQARPSYKDAN